MLKMSNSNEQRSNLLQGASLLVWLSACGIALLGCVATPPSKPPAQISVDQTLPATNRPVRSASLAAPIPSFTASLTTNQLRGLARVTLAFDYSPDPSAVGYRVYYGVGSGHYTNSFAFGNTNLCTVSGLVWSNEYAFAVTAYNSTGEESVFSNEVLYTPIPKPATNYVTQFIEMTETLTGPISWQTYFSVTYTNPPGVRYFRYGIATTNGINVTPIGGNILQVTNSE